MTSEWKRIQAKLSEIERIARRLRAKPSMPDPEIISIDALKISTIAMEISVQSLRAMNEELKVESLQKGEV